MPASEREPAVYPSGGGPMTRRILAVVALAAATVGCSANSSATAAAASGCAAPAPSSAGAWQSTWDKLPYNGDGNFSTGDGRLPGRSFWVTGDSVPRAGGQWASNTVIVVDGCRVRQVPNVVPDRPTAAGVTSWWPGPVAPLHNGYVSAGSWVRRTPGVGLGFVPLRSELGLFYADGSLAGLARVPSSPLGVRWSAGAWSGSDGWLYVWGTTDGKPGQWGVDAYVSRVDQRTLTAWRYWTGSTWATAPASARPLLSVAAGTPTDTAFSVSRDSSGWHVYTRRVTWTSSEHGEYVGGPKVWTWRPGGTEPGYLPSVHPESTLASGKRLVTLNVAGVGAQFLEVG